MNAAVRLKTAHLWISADLAASAFGDTTQVYVVYYPQMKALLLAPMDDSLFTMHKNAGLQMLKIRNAQGDRTISLQEILIDHDIDPEEKDLTFMHQEGVRLLHVTL
jgi:hypothetical protein